MYTAQERHGWNMENVRNFSKCAGNSQKHYNPLIDYVGLLEGSGPKISLPYTDYGESIAWGKHAISLRTMPHGGMKGREWGFRKEDRLRRKRLSSKMIPRPIALKAIGKEEVRLKKKTPRANL